MRHPDVIRFLIEITKPQSYLELGLYEGETFEVANSLVSQCVGVDIKDVRKQKIGEFHEMTTHDFFARNNQMYDMIFIDADHSFKSVKADFLNSLNILRPGGTIILHDTDPVEKKYVDPGYCGDAYKINKYLKSLPHINFLVLPVHTEGLTIVRFDGELRHK